MMTIHYIMMSSSYVDGTRIALDFTGSQQLNSERIIAALQTIQQRCGKDVPLSTHCVQTDSDTWESVIAYDSFFDGVQLIKTVEEFAAKIEKSRILSGVDVAHYILSQVCCTHLSLEKLVYLAYADYLCDHGERLFRDNIYAFRYGPVVESVYEAYKQYGAQDLARHGGSAHTESIAMAMRSRILFAKRGIAKLHAIDQTIRAYGKLSVNELVTLTHQPGAPWSHVDSTIAYQIIPDELIARYHAIERKAPLRTTSHDFDINF